MYTVRVRSHTVVLGVIPARGGSKRLPGKNIALLGGKPLIVHSIHAALGSGVIDRVIVSTDDDGIAAVASSAGADVPFMRPPHLSTDDATSVDVLVHALEWFKRAEGYEPACVFLLQPTSPLRTAEDIRACRALLVDGVDAVAGVSDDPRSPCIVTPNADGTVTVAPHDGSPLPPGTFSLNGAAYLIRTDVFLNERTLHPRRTVAYVMPSDRSVDVDTAEDFARAEELHAQGLRRANASST